MPEPSDARDDAPDDRDDDRLVRLAREGSADAYEVLVRRYQDVAFRLACAIVHDAGEAEDAAQVAFVKAYHALGRFRDGAAFRPWFLKIVGNEARNRRAAAHRRLSRLAGLDEVASLPGAGPDPERHSLRRERDDELLAAIDALRPEERLVVTCRYLLGLSERETAAALGVRAGTVKSRLSRALSRLRVELTRDTPEQGATQEVTTLAPTTGDAPHA